MPYFQKIYEYYKYFERFGINLFKNSKKIRMKISMIMNRNVQTINQNHRVV